MDQGLGALSGGTDVYRDRGCPRLGGLWGRRSDQVLGLSTLAAGKRQSGGVRRRSPFSPLTSRGGAPLLTGLLADG